MERVQKILAGWGVASRRAAEAMLAAGRVAVNGAVVGVGAKADAATDRIEVDGAPVGPPDRRPLTLVLHKPEGVVATVRDPHAAATVIDLVPARWRQGRRLWPIGRLDRDSSGLLLISDDGALTHRCLHPRFKLPKTYRVRLVAGPLTSTELRRFRDGIELSDGCTAPCEVQILGKLEYQVVLCEGRNRQIRRMFGALGRQVAALCRLGFGPIGLGDLAPGGCRPLAADELARLRQAIEGGSEPAS